MSVLGREKRERFHGVFWGSARVTERLLSPRQSQCLDLVRQGMTSQEIADLLGISRRTVDQYIAEAARRLGSRRRAQTVAEAVRLGMI